RRYRKIIRSCHGRSMRSRKGPAVAVAGLDWGANGDASDDRADGSVESGGVTARRESWGWEVAGIEEVREVVDVDPPVGAQELDAGGGEVHGQPGGWRLAVLQAERVGVRPREGEDVVADGGLGPLQRLLEDGVGGRPGGLGDHPLDWHPGQRPGLLDDQAEVG